MKQVEGLFFTNLSFVGELGTTGVHEHFIHRDIAVSRYFTGGHFELPFETLRLFRSICDTQEQADRLFVSFAACQGNLEEWDNVPKALKQYVSTWRNGESIGQWYWNMALSDIVSWPKAIPAFLKTLFMGRANEDSGKAIYDMIERTGVANRYLVLLFILKINVNEQRVERKVGSHAPIDHKKQRKWIIDANFGYFDRAIQAVDSYLEPITGVEVLCSQGKKHKRAKSDNGLSQCELRNDFYAHFQRVVPRHLRNDLTLKETRDMCKLLGSYVWIHCLYGLGSHREDESHRVRIVLTRGQ